MLSGEQTKKLFFIIYFYYLLYYDICTPTQTKLNSTQLSKYINSKSEELTSYRLMSPWMIIP